MAVQQLRPTLLYGAVGKHHYSGRVAGFDLDGTLVGSIRERFAVANHVLAKLKELSQTHDLVIFSNQAPPHPLDLGARLVMLLGIFQEHKIPISIYVALAKDCFRKPEIGMWLMFSHQYQKGEEKGGVPMDTDDPKEDRKITEVSFTGDAAGRNGPLHFDHSDSDRAFAVNLNNWRYLQQLVAESQGGREALPPKVTFYTPQERFSFDLQQVLPYDLILLVGPPASGKSTVARKLRDELKYEIVSRDNPDIRTMPKCIKLVQKLLGEGKKVVVDNLNPHPEARGAFLNLIRTSSELFKTRHHALALDMNISMLEAVTRNSRRDKDTGKVANVVIYTFRKNYQPPTLAEGFEKVLYVQ